MNSVQDFLVTLNSLAHLYPTNAQENILVTGLCNNAQVHIDNKLISWFVHWESSKLSQVNLTSHAHFHYFLSWILVRNSTYKMKEKSKPESLFHRLLLTLVSILWEHLRMWAFVGIVERMFLLHLSNFFVFASFPNRSAKAVIML